jgi:hypothetical protein
MVKKIKAISAEGRISAILLSGLPFFVLGGIWAFNPGYYRGVQDDPLFPGIMGSGAALLLVGIGAMWRMVSIRSRSANNDAIDMIVSASDGRRLRCPAGLCTISIFPVIGTASAARTLARRRPQAKRSPVAARDAGLTIAARRPEIASLAHAGALGPSGEAIPRAM